MNWDTSIFFWLNALVGHSALFDQLILFTAFFLPYLVVFGFLLLLLLTRRERREKMRIFAIVTLSVILARALITEFIYMIFHRSRPYLTHEVNQLLSVNEWSFPSGHAAFFFAMGVALFFFHKKWGYWCLVLATIIAVSRVIAGIHYPSDILAGALIGGVSAWTIHFLMKRLFVQKRPFSE